MATPAICSVDGCGKPPKARGLCSMHYGRKCRAEADFGLCTKEGCKTPAANHRGLCNAHYLKARRRGDVMPGEAMRRSSGEVGDWLAGRLELEQDECIVWPFSIRASGYPAITWGGKAADAHRVVCEIANGPPPTEDHHAAHSCGNRKCVNRGHLRWALPIENSADCIAHGTWTHGEASPNAKLTETQVLAIHALPRANYREVADRFGVSQGTIAAIWAGRTWAWLTNSSGKASASS